MVEMHGWVSTPISFPFHALKTSVQVFGYVTWKFSSHPM